MAGIDAGLSALLTLSDARKIDAPRLARKAEKRIRRLNRERDRRRKGSVNRRRTRARLARLHRRTRNQRGDHMHKLTRALVDAHGRFAVEDLSTKGWFGTSTAKSAADAGVGGMFRVLRYKAQWAGRAWYAHPRFERTTGVCPDCNLVGPKLDRGLETWTCSGCGAVHDRDVAAARVLLKRATDA